MSFAIKDGDSEWDYPRSNQASKPKRLSLESEIQSKLRANFGKLQGESEFLSMLEQHTDDISIRAIEHLAQTWNSQTRYGSPKLWNLKKSLDAIENEVGAKYAGPMPKAQVCPYCGDPCFGNRATGLLVAIRVRSYRKEDNFISPLSGAEPVAYGVLEPVFCICATGFALARKEKCGASEDLIKRVASRSFGSWESSEARDRANAFLRECRLLMPSLEKKAENI